MSTLAIELVQKCLSDKDPYLDLGRCGLTDESVAEGTELDKLLRKCGHLETLILSNKWAEWDLNKGWTEKKAGTMASKMGSPPIRPPLKHSLILSNWFAQGTMKKSGALAI